MSNDPIMRIDPSGHSDYRDRMNRLRKAYGNNTWKERRKAYHRWGDEALPEIPSWWESYRFFNVEGYGTFDKKHLQRGWTIAKLIDESIGTFEYKEEVGWGYSDYYAKYSISGRKSLELMYGIYADLEIGFEQHQGGFPWLKRFSSFSPEDLASDHIGFWAYHNGYGKEEIPFVLERLGKVSPTIPSALAVDIKTSGGQTVIIPLPKNHEFLPMAPLTYNEGGMSGITWQNVSWPSWLEIVPIPSGPDTWQRIE